MATTTFSTPGSTTWSVPAGVTSIFIQCWGAGGGGGASGTTNGRGGCGGSGGNYASANYSVTPGMVLFVNVGTVGTGGVAGNNNGVDGGNSYVLQNGTSTPNFALAMGGRGGIFGSATPTTTLPNSGLDVGTTIFLGGNGAAAINGTSSGGGGGGAGTTGAGGNSPTGAAQRGTGTSLNGGNGGLSVAAGNNTGNIGSNYGGGGSGGYRSSANRAGGNGAQGLVTITYNVRIPRNPGTIGHPFMY